MHLSHVRSCFRIILLTSGIRVWYEIRLKKIRVSDAVVFRRKLICDLASCCCVWISVVLPRLRGGVDGIRFVTCRLLVKFPGLFPSTHLTARGVPEVRSRRRAAVQVPAAAVVSCGALLLRVPRCCCCTVFRCRPAHREGASRSGLLLSR
jgi:hypothetical protein